MSGSRNKIIGTYMYVVKAQNASNYFIKDLWHPTLIKISSGF